MRSTRSKSGKPSIAARHASHKARELRGDERRCTRRQKAKITEMLCVILEKMTPRKLADKTTRSNAFWYAARSGKWGNCKPTVQDYKDIQRVYDIVILFKGKLESLMEIALDIANSQARTTILIDKFLREAEKIR